MDTMKNMAYVLGTLVLVSCGTKTTTKAPDATTTEAAAVEVNEIETPKARPVYHASETVLTDLLHTRLDVRFDWSNSRLIGKATITAKPHFYASDLLILDAKGMEISTVRMGEKVLKFNYMDDILSIQLGKTYRRDESYTLTIDYIAKPEERETGGSAAITSDKGLYFINPQGKEKNKMPQIWTQGETEASSVWFPTIDAPNSKTSQEIYMTVDDKYVTLSNGKFMGSTKNADGTRTDHWKQELPHAPYLFMMGVGEFKVVKDTYTRSNGTPMEVNYYVEPEWEQYADDIFGETPEMIDFFSKKLGVEYAWDKYHQIVVREYVSGAMENTGAVIFGDFVYKTDRELLDENSESIIAHELFHHWFGDYVTCESWSNLPLNESFANYSQYLWDEHRHGLDEADYYAEKEADGYYQSAGTQGHHNLIWWDYDEREQMFDGHSYNKGGRILHMLRNYVGDEAFFQSLNLYLTEHKFEAAEFHQLRLAFEKVTGEDLNWFFNQWFLGSGHPELVFEQSVTNGEVTLNVRQKQKLETTPIYKLPFEVAVFDGAGIHVHKVVLEEIEQSFTFPVTGELKCLIPDFQQCLLAKVSENKPQEQFQQQYHLGERWRARDRALRYGTKKMDSLAQQLVLDALHDDFWSIRSLAIEKSNRLKDGFKAIATDIIHTMAREDESSAVRAMALTFLEQNGSPNENEQLAEQLIASDSSYLVVTTALRVLADVNPEKAMKLAEGLENEPSSKMLVGIAGVYSDSGDPSKFDFFKTLFEGNRLGGFDEIGVMNLFSTYLARQQVSYWKKAIPIYQNLKTNGTFYTQMFLPQNVQYLLKAANDKQSELETKMEVSNADSKAKLEAELQEWKEVSESLTKLLN